MKLRMWSYFLRQALMNIMNNRLVHVIGLGTMFVSILIFGAFLLLFVNLNVWVQGVGQALSMSVYLDDGISVSKRDMITSWIKSLPTAKIDRFIAKKDALKELRGVLGPQAGLLEGLSANPLPASLEVVFEKINGQKIDPERIKKELEKMEGVEEVQYSEEWLKQFKGLLGLIRMTGLIIGGLLCLGILFIITNTIKLTIYSRKEEIEILKLVGATDWFVKIPFLLEGAIQGILSGILALLILLSGYYLFTAEKMLFTGVGVFDLIFLPHKYSLLIFLASVILGLAGSLIAVRRFFDI
jgi:cell division transport system permease protein